MKSQKLLICFFMRVTLGQTEENEVLSLKNNDFKKTIAGNTVFVEFFEPMSSPFVLVYPIWSQLADTLKASNDTSVLVAQVNCDDEQELCGKQGITKYPTMTFFMNNTSEAVEYTGERDMASLTQFIKQQMASPKLIELSISTFSKHLSIGRHFIMFYATWCGYSQALSPVWSKLVNSLQQDAGVSISKFECRKFRPFCRLYRVNMYPTLLWIEDGQKIAEYLGERTIENFKMYIERMTGAKPADQPAL